VEEVITVVLVGDGNILLKAPRSNEFDQPILGFVIASKISGADLLVSGDLSMYNLVAVSAAADISL
jgi:hypothetical protein